MAADARKKAGAEAMETLAERPGQVGALEKVA
jgi:hypothetical protein